MIRRILLAIAACFLAVAANAQTTTFLSSDCAPSITITGSGLILTGTASGTNAGCRASVGKTSGKWYYTATVNLSPVAPAFGVASKKGTSGGYDPTSTADPGASVFGAVYDSTSSAGKFFFNNNSTATGTGPVVNGKTLAIVVDMDTDSPQFWMTPDITGTSGAGGGPLWNGSSSSTPNTPNTGLPLIPLTQGGTGQQFYVSSADFSVYPVFKSNGPDAATFSFASNSTLDTLLGGAGYQPWNTNGGNPPTQQQIVVANAPEWVASTSYTAGDRVIAGPGWTPGSPGSYTQGAAIYLWALRGSTSGTSGSTQPGGFASCTTPANVGGGLDGSIPSGWSGATTVTDNGGSGSGGVTWVCLAKVDYVTMSDFGADDVPWAINTQYHYQSWTINAGNAYFQTNQVDNCTSASSGSGPTVTSGSVADGTCNWAFMEHFTYSSQNNRWAHQYTLGGVGHVEIGYGNTVVMTQYHGGQARNMYQAGANGEMNPIPSQNHFDLAGDWPVYCYKGLGVTAAASGGIDCAGQFATAWWQYQAASGDGVNPGLLSGAVRIDPTKAVTWFSNTAHSGGAPFPGAPVGLSDSIGNIIGVQIHSTQWLAIDAHEPGAGPGNGHTDDIQFQNVIVESDGGPGAVDGDANFNFLNSAIIWNGTSSNGFGIYVGYPGFLYNVTLRGPVGGGGASNSTGIVSNSTLPGLSENLVNIAVFGFANPIAFTTVPTIVANNNATDTPTSFSGSTYNLGIDGLTVTSQQLPGAGSLTNLVIGNQFVNPTVGSSLDLSVKNSSAAIYGAGASASFTNPTTDATLTNAFDIFGTARPQSHGYDIGAEEFISGPPPPSLAAGGRLYFH